MRVWFGVWRVGAKISCCWNLLLITMLHHAAHAQNHHPPPMAHEHMTKDELTSVFQVSEHHEVPEYEIVKVVHRKQKRSSDSNDHVHQVSLAAFGRDLELELVRNLHLVPEVKPLNLYFAEKDNDDISYIEDDQNAGVDIGDVYQDETNQAALLLYKHTDRDKYLMDGTIGDDLVVKPVPASLERLLEAGQPIGGLNQQAGHLNQSFNLNQQWRSWSLEEEEKELPEDYAFLDEEDADEEPRYVLQEAGSQGHNWRRYRRDAEGSQHCSGCLNTGYHIVYKRGGDSQPHHTDYDLMETEVGNSPGHTVLGEKILSREKRQAPFIIFPEILVIVDYDGYRLHGEDNVAIKRYVISFWNGVDLRYKLLKGPSVKISIAGIIISRGRDATPYLERNRVGRDAIDAASALTDMGKYLFLERRLPVYDIAVAITKLDMCRRKTRHGDCNRGTAGFAYVGGACVVNKRLEKVNSVAIVEDTGGFSGIIVAAHELGHLLGAVHDGSPPPSYLGGPGAVKCRWEDGFIMSDLRHTSKGFKWSICTVQQFHHFLNGETATCMYNSPHEEESLPRVLPGKLLSLDAQCRKDRGTSACFKDDRVCAQLFCFDAGSGYCVSYRPAAEGSRCGDNQMCLNGKCVSDTENSIDYSDAFVRRTGTDIHSHTTSTTTQRSWWLDLVTSAPPTPTTTERVVSVHTTAPWWKRLQQKTLARHNDNNNNNNVDHSNSLLEELPGSQITASTESILELVFSTESSGGSSSSSSSTTTTPSTTSTTTTTTTVESSSVAKTTTSSIISTSTATVPPPITSSSSSLSYSSSSSSSSVSSSSSITSSSSRSRSRARSRAFHLSRSTSKSSSSTSSSSSEASVDSEFDDSEAEENDLNRVGLVEDANCEDRITNIAGSMSCKAFLQSFAYQYCRHKYIKKNCCASHKRFCSGSTHG